MKLRKGEVYCRKDQCTGYFMVMGFKGDMVKTSPLFWCEAITYQYKRKQDMKSDYQVHSGQVSHPIVKARYDHEKMRRLNKL